MNRDESPLPPAPRSQAEREAALAALFEAAQADPRRHDFFALLRRVESLQPQRPRLGRALRPSQEALRLGQEPELDFAPAALERVDAAAPNAPRVGVRFFGLLGPQGPMPLHFTEYVRERLRFRGDATLLRFLDTFHHRLLALFYRAWAQGQPTVHLDRPDDDRFAAWLGAACGLNGEQPGQSTLPAAARLFQAGLLGTRSRHPEGLTKLLSQYFGVPVRVEQHVLQWLVLDTGDRTRLGLARSRGERTAPAALGRSTTCGGKRRDRQFKFRIALGPLTLARYHDFLPGGVAWQALRDWVRQYTGFDLQWDVQLTLACAHVPEPRLGRHVRLGVTTWIGRGGRSRDRDDLRLRPDTSFLLHHGVHHA
ncbi:type VI secretion system baseplate subunit TssG [Piscinibacter sp. XHJ-5]|uniref:type VI secretion system baseplate subunit TssG n=1 Tax=Piscinibacter sp. XHJ-5 TaxID=3037797 RepID=UPI0024533E2F|nr:type VI secretion system baseplate subunit TssG [Piscinibacter sp. XHJ-5]